MPASSLLDPEALGLGRCPTFGDLLTDKQRRRVSDRAAEAGGPQFATDILAWLDAHEPPTCRCPESEPAFDPATDGIHYCDSEVALLTSRGLRSESIDYYRRLCRLMPAGKTAVQFHLKSDLYRAILLQAIRTDEVASGLGDGRQKGKLDTLVRQGFVEFVDGVLRFLPPESWRVRGHSTPPKPKVRSVDETQGRLFRAEEADETRRHLAIFT